MDKKFLERLEKLMKQSPHVKESYDCSKCRDLGYTFITNEDGCEMAKPCECLAKKQAFEKLQKCGLSDVFKTKNFSTYICHNQNQALAKQKALIFCSGFMESSSSLILSGPPGVGKTHLGVAVMLKLINENITCRYVEYNNMIVNLKQSIMDDENHMREMEKYINPRVLFIDDFLKGKINEVDLNYIYRIINTRYLLNKPLIISTEKSIKEMISWDEAVASRLVEMSGENIISFGENNKNHRLKGYLQ